MLLEQELATSETNETVKQFLHRESERIGHEIQVDSWALFAIK